MPSAGAPRVGSESGLGAVKLQRVVYGRLRFITRLLGPGYWLRFFAGYLLEDLLNGLLYLVRGRFGTCVSALSSGLERLF